MSPLAMSTNLSNVELPIKRYFILSCSMDHAILDEPTEPAINSQFVVDCLIVDHIDCPTEPVIQS